MKLDFNDGWKFSFQGGREKMVIKTPHDAMLASGRAADNPSGSAGAYFAGGAYVYEKDFDVPISWKGKKVIFRFEGVYQTAVVWINDTEAGRIFYGYSMTDITAEDCLVYGRTNTIRVEVDNTRQPNSRWYSGAGIYRPVTLYVLDKERIKLDGVKIRTISTDPAQIEVKTAHTGGEVRVTILDAGKVIAEGTGEQTVIGIPDAKLWSDETPHLYTCRTELWTNGRVTDMQEEKFGVRTVEWSPKGLFINGKETLLRGGCLHHDNGVLGACGYEEAEWRRVRILKENGFNAIRSAHNPCTKAMLEACDALGVYMMDETWDMWYRHKSKEDYASYFMEHYRDDITSMVRKDYNHPSVILYSIGNEVSEPSTPEGREIEQDMVNYLHELDDSRAVTAGFNLMIIASAAKGKQMYDGEGGLNTDAAEVGEEQKGGGMHDLSQMDSTMFNMMAMQIGNGMNHSADSDEADAAISPGVDILDIAGYNYGSGRYPLDGEKHPERIIYGSETLPPDIYRNWKMVEHYPYLIGDFMWTAWDYLGEAGIGAWTDSPDAMAFDKPYPWLIGGAGVINILGDPDGEALYAKVVWGQEHGPRIAVRPVTMPEEKTIKSAWRGTNAFPAWSYRGHSGEMTKAEVYGRGESVELFINGRSQGKKALEEYRAIFDVAYEDGEVKAVMYGTDGTVTGSDSLCSATGEITVRIKPESEAVNGKLLFVNIDLCGENGMIERAADETLRIEVDGGDLLGYGSANPHTRDSFTAGEYVTYYGRSQAVILVKDAEHLRMRAVGTQKTVEKEL